MSQRFFICAMVLLLASDSAQSGNLTPHRDLRYQGVVGQTDWFTCDTQQAASKKCIALQ